MGRACGLAVLLASFGVAVRGACPVAIRMELVLHGEAYANKTDLAAVNKEAPLVQAITTALSAPTRSPPIFSISSCAATSTTKDAEATTCVVDACLQDNAGDSAAASAYVTVLRGSTFGDTIEADLAWTDLKSVDVKAGTVALTCDSCDNCPAASHAMDKAEALKNVTHAGQKCSYQPGLCADLGDAVIREHTVASETDYGPCCAACAAETGCKGWQQKGLVCSLLSQLDLSGSLRGAGCATGAVAGAALSVPALKCRQCGVGMFPKKASSLSPAECTMCKAGSISVHGVCEACTGEKWSNEERTQCSGKMPVWKKNWFLGLMCGIVVAFAMFRHFRQCCERKAKGERFEPEPVVPEGTGAAIVARETAKNMAEEAPVAGGGSQGQGPFVL